MTITLENLDRLTLEQMREFVRGSRTIELAPAAEGRAGAYKLIERVLKAQQYKRLPKTHEGIVRRFLMKVTRLSRAQVTRLVAQWMESRQVRVRHPLHSRGCEPAGVGRCRARGFVRSGNPPRFRARVRGVLQA